MRSPKPRHRLVDSTPARAVGKENKLVVRQEGPQALHFVPPAPDAKMASHFDETATRGCLLRSVLHLSKAAGRINFQADRKLICCRVFRPNHKSFLSKVCEDDNEHHQHDNVIQSDNAGPRTPLCNQTGHQHCDCLSYAIRGKANYTTAVQATLATASDLAKTQF